MFWAFSSELVDSEGTAPETFWFLSIFFLVWISLYEVVGGLSTFSYILFLWSKPALFFRVLAICIAQFLSADVWGPPQLVNVAGVDFTFSHRSVLCPSAHFMHLNSLLQFLCRWPNYWHQWHWLTLSLGLNFLILIDKSITVFTLNSLCNFSCFNSMRSSGAGIALLEFLLLHFKIFTL